MTPTDYAMLALGTLSLAVFAFAGGVAVMVLIDELIPNIERITAALFPVTNAAPADTVPNDADLQEHVHG
jgi:hypothetical protein